MIPKSIRWRIQAWHGSLLMVLVAGMLAAFYAYERGERIRAIDSQLQSLLTPLLPRVTRPSGPGFDGGPPEGRPDTQHRPALPEFKHGQFYFSAWSPGHELISHSPGAAVPMPARGESGKQQSLRIRGDFRELVYVGPRGDCVVIGTSIARTAAELRRLAWTLVAAGFGLTVFGLAGGWWVAGHALRPVAEISATARQIAGGNRAKRINVGETESELGQLAEVLNQTFDQQDRAFEQQVRFTADASHELRTPVSVILTQSQLALSREREAREYRETLQICQRAAERMRSLVHSLLELARVDSGEFQLTLEECDLAAVATDALDLIAPLARKEGAVLRSSIQPVRARADAGRIGQVLVNLLGNAIQHNTREVEVHLSVERCENEAVLRVSDNGAGIPAEALPHIFERFYRADKSRTASRSGSGLGLAISQAIIQAHGGTIRAENQPQRGAVFTVILPLAG